MVTTLCGARPGLKASCTFVSGCFVMHDPTSSSNQSSTIWGSSSSTSLGVYIDIICMNIMLDCFDYTSTHVFV